MNCLRSTGLALFALGCTRLNPAFHDDVADDTGDDVGDGDGDGDGDSNEAGTGSSDDSDADSSDADSTGSSEDGPVDTTGDDETGTFSDLPPEGCGYPLSGGLELSFGDPFYLDGECPDTLQLVGRIALDPNQNPGFFKCDGDDSQCQGPCTERHPLAIPTFDLAENLDFCVTVQAEGTLGANSDACSWGAVSVFPSGNPYAPLAIATTQSYPPTVSVQGPLGGEPGMAEVEMCECGIVPGVDVACCNEQTEQVTFFKYLLSNGESAYPSDTKPFDIPSSPYEYSFWAAQAQKVGYCNAGGSVATSWVITADF